MDSAYTELLVQFGLPAFTILLTAIVKSIFENRPKLITYLSHASSFTFPIPPQMLQRLYVAIFATMQPGQNQTAPSAAASVSNQNPAALATPAQGADAPPNTAPAIAPTAPPAAAPATPPATGALPPGLPPTLVFNTHSILVRNAGNKTAFNVRIGHHAPLVLYQLAPTRQHQVNQIPNGGWEILLPTLVPDEEIQVSYLYLAPTTWNQINSYAKSDGGSARVLNVLPTPQLPLYARVIRTALLYLGLFAFVYILVATAQWAYSLSAALRVAAL